jgi:hypothetical protein
MPHSREESNLMVRYDNGATTLLLSLIMLAQGISTEAASRFQSMIPLLTERAST